MLGAPAVSTSRMMASLRRSHSVTRSRGLPLWRTSSGRAVRSGASGVIGGARWLVDPIDGTVNFAHGLPLWAISIGLEDEAGLAVGVVHATGAAVEMSTSPTSAAHAASSRPTMVASPIRKSGLTAPPRRVPRPPARITAATFTAARRGPAGAGPAPA